QLTTDRQFVTKSLAGTRVLFDGVPSPMVYSIAGQVSAVGPYRVNGRITTSLQVEYNGRTSNAVTMNVVSTVPGIFTLDSSGRGHGAILNEDYKVNGASRPAAWNSVVMVYATGGGQTTPESEDG